METSWVLQVGLGVAVVGFFVAAWFRFSRPIRFKSTRHRTAPQLQGLPSGEVRSSVEDRRAPSL